MPMATDTLCEPNTLPTTVGIDEKKPPFAAPLTTTKNARGPRPVDAGQTANRVMALMNRQKKRVFREPNLSQSRPLRTLPTADDMLKPAKSPAPVEVERPMDALYNGRKKGGTSSGNVATAPAAKTTEN